MVQVLTPYLRHAPPIRVLEIAPEQRLDGYAY